MADQSDQRSAAGDGEDLTPPPPPEAPPSVGSPLAPVGERERIASIDVLRGVAVLGIFVMNIPWMANSPSWFMDPARDPNYDAWDQLAWLFSHLFFDAKMMAIFSALFGAGIIIMTQRAEARGASLLGVYYRRMGWLLFFGMIHAYLIWEGDILVTYALCGMLLYPLRRLPSAALLAIGLIAVMVFIPLNIWMGEEMIATRQKAGEIESMLAQSGEPATPEQQGILDAWDMQRVWFDPSPEQLEEEAQKFQEGYVGFLPHRASFAFGLQMYFLFWGLWRAGGLMLVGMALMKWGVFSATRTPRFYVSLMIAGYLVGLSIVGYGVDRMVGRQFSFEHVMTTGLLWNYVGSLFVALGHVGLVMTLCRIGALKALQRILAAVGRMAFTNYIAQSVIGTLIFYGYGLGLWGEYGRAEMLLFVGGVWAILMIWSPLWLRAFRAGPLEWLWRSLTYWKAQPLRRAA